MWEVTCVLKDERGFFENACISVARMWFTVAGVPGSTAEGGESVAIGCSFLTGEGMALSCYGKFMKAG